MAQREEFLKRFYGKPALEQAEELDKLLAYSMNVVDEPSMYRTRITEDGDVTYETEEPPTEGGVGAENPDPPEMELAEPPPETDETEESEESDEAEGELPFEDDGTYPDREDEE